MTTACGELVVLAEKLATETTDAKAFLFALGAQAAGVRRGPVGYLDLARGGRNIFPGGGVQLDLDDDSGGQIRHFAGIVAASVRVGPKLARWLSVNVGRDSTATPDGRLTDVAIDFSREVLSGELAIHDTSAWLSQHVCA